MRWIALALGTVGCDPSRADAPDTDAVSPDGTPDTDTLPVDTDAPPIDTGRTGDTSLVADTGSTADTQSTATTADTLRVDTGDTRGSRSSDTGAPLPSGSGSESDTGQPYPPGHSSPPCNTGDTTPLYNTADTGVVETGDTGPDVIWRDVANGSNTGVWPESDSGDSGFYGIVGTCSAVTVDLVTNQADLDAFGAMASYDFTGTVDFLTEVAVTASAVCSVGPVDMLVTDVTDDGAGGLTVHYELNVCSYCYGAVTTPWNVIAVSGTSWTSVSAVDVEVQLDSGGTGDSCDN